MLELDRCASWFRRSLPFLVLLGTGCPIPIGDPEGPGVSGSVSLGTGVDSGTFQTLALRAFPDSRDTFDPAASLPAITFDWRQDDVLAGLVFPYAFQLGEVLGTTTAPDWRIVAWLSHQAQPTAIDKNDVFCTARFRLKGCDEFGGYCGVKRDVTCALDQVRNAAP
jgi:hypothetical protein